MASETSPSRPPTTRRRTTLLATVVAVLALAGVVLPAGPAAAANLPGGGYAFTVLEDGRLVVIDRATKAIADSVTLPGTSSPPTADIQTSADQTTVYVVDATAILVVDARSLTVTGTFSDDKGFGFASMAISPDGTRLYGYTTEGWVDVVQLPSLTLLGRVQVGETNRPYARRMAADNTAAYVSTDAGVKVVPRDASASTKTYNPGPQNGAVVAAGGNLYVSQKLSPQSTVRVLQASTGAFVRDFYVNKVLGDQWMTMSPNGQHLYNGSSENAGIVQRTDLSDDNTAYWLAFRWTAGVAVGVPGTDTDVYVPLVGNHTEMALVQDWREPTAVTVPAAAWAVTMVDLTAVPGAPTITSLSNAAGQVTVAFTPGTSGTNPTTGYRVTATDVTNPSRGGQTATGAGSPITVPGLSNGDGYTFTVTALSPGGNSAPSAPSNPLTVGVPPTLTGTPPPGKVGVAYSYQLAATGIPAPDVELNVGTPLPPGLTFDVGTLTIHGTPTVAGSTFLDFTATNALATVSLTPTLTIDPVRSTVEQTPTVTSTTTTTTTPPPSSSPPPTSSSSTTPVSAGTTPPSAAYRSPVTSSGALASTGTPVEPLLLGAAALLLVGTALLLATRIRRRS